MTGAFWLRVAGVVGALGVTIGAFGAHGLKEMLEKANRAATFQTGVEYHLYHALALLAVGLGASLRPGRAWDTAGWSFLVGIFLFSGSLYGLSLTGQTKLGMIAPLGGLLFIVGWVAIAFAAGSVGGKVPPNP